MAAVQTGFVKGTKAYRVALNCDDTKTVVLAAGAAPVPDPSYQLTLEWGLAPPAGVTAASYETRIQAEALAIAVVRAQELAG